MKQLITAFSEKGGIFMFLRAQLSAQLATVTDFVITIALAQFFGMYYVYATCIGSVCGGMFNCFVNYEWTFKCHECKKSHVIISIHWCGQVVFFEYIRDVLSYGMDSRYFMGQRYIKSLLQRPFYCSENSGFHIGRTVLELLPATCVCISEREYEESF